MSVDQLKNGSVVPAGQQQHLSKIPLMVRQLIQQVIFYLEMRVSPVTHPRKKLAIHRYHLSCGGWAVPNYSLGAQGRCLDRFLEIKEGKHGLLLRLFTR
jgi:hypothetical protein